MSIDEQHVALPKLYGAPAYARPRPPVTPTPRPFDPDDLPIAVARTPEEQQIAETLPSRVYLPGGHRDKNGEAGHSSGGLGGALDARPFRLRSIAGRLFGGNS